MRGDITEQLVGDDYILRKMRVMGRFRDMCGLFSFGTG
jgi:hypothetical protein